MFFFAFVTLAAVLLHVFFSNKDPPISETSSNFSFHGSWDDRSYVGRKMLNSELIPG